MNIEIYLDGADLESMKALGGQVAGFTTNPSLCRASGVTDYREFCKQAIEIAAGKPISLEVFADDEHLIFAQAKEISSWGANVWVKVPIIYTSGESTAPLLERLAADQIRVNVTAIMTKDQVRKAADAVDGTQAILSVFAGRIADAGRDPIKVVRYASSYASGIGGKALWASVREVYNIIQADECGCDIITCSPAILAKLPGLGADLTVVSLATVKQFYEAGKGYSL